MTIRKPRTKGVRILLALLFVIGTTAFATLGAQQSALASGCSPSGSLSTTLTFPAGTCYTIPAAHLCESIGTLSNGNQADICTDIYTSWSDSGDWIQIWGTGEYYCQGPDTQCKGIHGYNTLSVADAELTLMHEYSANYTCSTTSCPNGGRAKVSTTHYATFESGKPCFGVAAEIPTGDAILVYGTSTAFHPSADWIVSARMCYS